MKVQQKLDKVLETARLKAQEEVSALMGVELKLLDFVNTLISKKDYFAESTGKKILAKLDISGEIEGFGCLVVDIKDAIRLGGTLIMLPKVELEEVVKNEEYSDETEDSYGEIANIICGAFTKVFEENYPKKCRFVRKEQERVVPQKIDTESNEPIPRQWYYLVRAGMTMDERKMGGLDLLIPAQPFDLEIPVDADETAAVDTVAVTAADTAADTVISTDGSSPSEEVSLGEQTPKREEKEATETQHIIEPPGISSSDLKKHQKLVDRLLDSCRGVISQEVGALLGVDVKLTKLGNKITSKEDFFLEETMGKQVLAHMDMVDGCEGKSYLFVGIKDAIRIGSILIMLPPAELENAVNQDEFSADVEDAYGEITNIISGVLTSSFKDQYTESIRFIKTDLELVTPIKVDVDSDDIIPNQLYYMSSSSLEIDGKKIGNLAMLFPADLLGLDQLINSSAKEDSKATAEIRTMQTPLSVGVEGAVGAARQSDIPGKASIGYEVLIIEDNHEEAEKIQEELKKSGLVVKRVSFNDNINHLITPDIKMIFIVMREVNEQAYGITIKVNSLSRAPIVAAGPEWTRSKVIKAVKYGVKDILLTPTFDNDIKEKIDNNLVRLAA